jgi:hypothetical protein
MNTIIEKISPEQLIQDLKYVKNERDNALADLVRSINRNDSIMTIDGNYQKLMRIHRQWILTDDAACVYKITTTKEIE